MKFHKLDLARSVPIFLYITEVDSKTSTPISSKNRAKLSLHNLAFN